MNMQEEKQVTIHINGCHVTVPASQEQIYREVLADRWFEGNHIYVKDGEVIREKEEGFKSMSLEALQAMLIDANNKRYALTGNY